MKEELISFHEEFRTRADTEGVESLWTIFKSQTFMDTYIPSKTLRGNKIQKPWISREVKSLMWKRKKLFNRQCKTRNARDIRLYKQTKAKIQQAERKSCWSFVDQIIDIGSPDQEY